MLHESVDYDSKSDRFAVISLEITHTGKDGVFYDSFINALDSATMKPIKISGIKKMSYCLSDVRSFMSRCSEYVS